MQYLDQKLKEYHNTDVYPFHMPGHKRRELEFENPYGIDITEIDGFDNLHHATGILKEAQERARELYGAKRSYYLINGSTCGILTAVCAATRKRDKVLMARNCHKAVYHATFLNELWVEYVYPDILENGIQGQITPEQVEKSFEQHPDISAVVITSPTYEGIVSDVAGIAKVAHAHGVPLIVDEAHGAHFGLSAGVPKEAGKEGADAVIMSLHKTLPSFTQTALLHLFSDRIDAEKVEKYLGIYETSSPSYLFMAGMDRCIRMLSKEKETLFSDYRVLLNSFYEEVRGLRNLHVMTREELQKEHIFDWDDSKLVIFSRKRGFTGKMLHEELLHHYHLQMEMVSAEYVLGMTSILDTKEGMDRLAYALKELDNHLDSVDNLPENAKLCGESSSGSFLAKSYRPKQKKMQIYQAETFYTREVALEEAIGEMSAEYVYLYPPGIPMIVPGEIIDKEFVQQIYKCSQMNLAIEGAKNIEQNRIKIVYL